MMEKKETLLNLHPLSNYQYDNLCGSLVISFPHSHLAHPPLAHEASEALMGWEHNELEWTKKRNLEVGGQ